MTQLSANPPPVATAIHIDTQAIERRRATLEQLGDAPIQPGPLLDLLNAKADDPNIVVRSLERCPVLAARVLAVTNSAGFGVAHPIQSLKRAVLHVGAVRARVIALAYALKLMGEQLDLDPEMQDRLWTSSLCKAEAARLAAERIEPGSAEAAYAAALIQDVGLARLVAVDPAFYDQPLTPDPMGDWCARERAHFGIDHAEVGAKLLERWQASTEICQAVRRHHHPPSEECGSATLVDTPGDALRRGCGGQSGARALGKLPGFIASLLPHMGELMTADQQQWLLTLHAQFLASKYENLEAFVHAACHAAAPMRGGRTHCEMLDAVNKRLPAAVAADSLSLVDQLSRLESALDRERRHSQTLQYEAMTDPLTHVLNRRGFSQLGRQRLEDAQRYRKAVCCIVLDLDNFKPINDRYGHERGDLMLQQVTRFMREHVDRADLIGRLGGDEFAVLVTVDDADQARLMTDRLAAAAKDYQVPIGDDVILPLAVSMGAVFVQVPDASTEPSLDDLIAAADEAMYQRKHGGKGGLAFSMFDA